MSGVFEICVDCYLYGLLSFGECVIVTLVRGEKVTQAAPAQFRPLFEGVVEFIAAWCFSLHAAPGKNVPKSLGKGLDTVFFFFCHTWTRMTTFVRECVICRA